MELSRSAARPTKGFSPGSGAGSRARRRRGRSGSSSRVAPAPRSSTSAPTPGTDVYSPVDGTVVSISDFVIDGKAYGSRIDVRPSAAPSLIVTLSHLAPDPSLAVGSPVLASSSKLGNGRRRGGRRAAGAREACPRPRQQRRDRRPPGRRVAPLNILFVADVVGRPGREALEDRLARLRTELGAAVCIVNGENVADGVGITPKLAERLLAAGADAITLGNHTWRRQEIAPYLATSDRVVRPANLGADAPGRGVTIVAARTVRRSASST